MTKLFFEMNAYDINTRIANEGRVPLVSAGVRPRSEARRSGNADEKVKATATLIDHPPAVPAFAYRFDTPDRSFVISGDTRRSDNVVKLARVADVLVHSALYVPAVDRLVAKVPNATSLKASIIAHQTSQKTRAGWRKQPA